jgi:hypothetical protein
MNPDVWNVPAALSPYDGDSSATANRSEPRPVTDRSAKQLERLTAGLEQLGLFALNWGAWCS